MGSSQSAHANNFQNHSFEKDLTAESCSVRGRKSSLGLVVEGTKDNNIISFPGGADHPDPLSIEDEDPSSDDDDDDDDDEAWNERLQILEDARNLKLHAQFVMFPERPVSTGFAATARCYFSRPSYPEHDDVEDEGLEERRNILNDAIVLKQYAEFYHYPEREVKADFAATARNFFTRPSAPEQDFGDEDESALDEALEERACILEDCSMLKKHAEFVMHPERQLETTPEAMSRSYFERPSAPHLTVIRESDDDADEEWEEYKNILEDAKLLKKHAEFVMYPERPVEVDPTATARCFFANGLPEQFDGDEVEIEEGLVERQRILADAFKLKEHASYVMYPERSVESDPILSARCFFDRSSAPEVDVLRHDPDEAERALIIAEAELLKKHAEFVMYPERSIEVDDFASARNFFTRPSAYTADEADDDSEYDMFMAERRQILEDAKLLKQHAEYVCHPEHSIAVDSTATARCYFDRPSAPQQDVLTESDIEDDELSDGLEERHRILEDADALKKHAEFVMHPERPIECDGVASARNYFDRPSVPLPDVIVDDDDNEVDEYWSERMQVLSESKLLKKHAEFVMYPDRSIEVDGFASARNFFTRPSAAAHMQSAEESTGTEPEKSAQPPSASVNKKDAKRLAKLETQLVYHQRKGNDGEITKIKEQINTIITKAGGDPLAV